MYCGSDLQIGKKREEKLARRSLKEKYNGRKKMITCPVYVFAGSKDNTLGVEGSIEIAEKLGCYIKVYDGYSHAVYDELPGFYDGVFSNLK